MSRWATLALVTLVHALGALAALAVAPLTPFLLEALQLTRAQVGLLLPSVYLGGVLMALPAGWLTDRLGVRTTLGLGQAVIGGGVILAAVASRSLASCLGFLLLAGFGFSVLNPATGKAVVDWFSPRERGVAMGIKQTGLTLGGLAGALILPPLALAEGWRRALLLAGLLSLVSAGLVALAYRAPAARQTTVRVGRPRLGQVTYFLRRPGLLVVFGCGLALSIAQSSVLAYLALYTRDSFGVSGVVAGQFLALATAGGTSARLVWGAISDRLFGGRRRPGVVINALIGAGAYAGLAAGAWLPAPLAVVLALLAGIGAFGWVGLYFALVAEIGGVRHAGLLTGLAVAFSWSGVLVGPPLFGLVLEATGAYTLPWLLLAAVALAVAFTLPRLRPLVRREPA
jgi:MFS family permease